jgi:hypothetical protein
MYVQNGLLVSPFTGILLAWTRGVGLWGGDQKLWEGSWRHLSCPQQLSASLASLLESGNTFEQGAGAAPLGCLTLMGLISDVCNLVCAGG